MIKQKLFRNGYVADLTDDLKKGIWKRYLDNKFKYTERAIIPNIEIRVNSPKLIYPKRGNLYNFENSKNIFEAYKTLNPTQATDIRLWTYLSHVTYWRYMRIRRPVEKQPKKGRVNYILTHWFIQRVNARNLLRHDISLLWWVPYLTYDKKQKDPYVLTKEAFSMLDYTRHLLSGVQGRNKIFAHALLEYVIENKTLFKNYKEARVRFLMRKVNFLAGYKVFPALSKNEIKRIFEQYRPETKNIK